MQLPKISHTEEQELEQTPPPDFTTRDLDSSKSQQTEKLELSQAPYFITREEYLSPHPKVQAALTAQGNWKEFWDNLQLSSEIDVDWFLERDLASIIVGKDDIIRQIKGANYDAALTQKKRVGRFMELRTLLFEIEFMKERGMRKDILSLEEKLREKTRDWEKIYNAQEKIDGFNGVIEILKKRGRYNRDKALEFINSHLPACILDYPIDYAKISAKMQEEFSPPTLSTLLGPKGSGKSLIQETLMEDGLELNRQLNVRGFELMARRNKKNKDRADLVKLIEGEFEKVEDFYFARQRSNRRKVAAIATAIASPAIYALFHFLQTATQTELTGIYSWWSAGEIDLLKQLGAALFANVDKILGAAAVAIAGTALGAYLKDRAERRSTRPIKVSSNAKFFSIGGELTQEHIEGTKSTSSSLPQDFKAGEIYKDGGYIVLEQPPTDRGVQKTLAQLLQEGRVPVAGVEGEETDIFAVIYQGLNPEMIGQLEPHYRDRLNNDPSHLFVENELPLTLMTHNQFQLFLEFFRRYKVVDSPSFSREALDELLEYSSQLAESTELYRIDRKFLSVVKDAIERAKLTQTPVTKEQVQESIIKFRSFNELPLQKALDDYRQTLPPDTAPIAGRTNVIAYLPQTFTNNNVEQHIIREIQREEGLSYRLPITAYVREKDTFIQNGPPPRDYSIEIDAPSWTDDEIKHSSAILENLIEQNCINIKSKLKGKNIVLDLTYAQNFDDVMIPGMYLALASAIRGEVLDQRKAVVAASDMSGRLTSPEMKINRRLISLEMDDNGPTTIVVPQGTIDSVFKTKRYPSYTFKEAQTLSDLYSKMKSLRK